MHSANYVLSFILCILGPRGQQAGSVPPATPNQMTGTSTSFDQEERGDLIKFYNQVYVQKMKAFALKFRAAQEVYRHIFNV